MITTHEPSTKFSLHARTSTSLRSQVTRVFQTDPGVYLTVVLKATTKSLTIDTLYKKALWLGDHVWSVQ